MPFESLAFLSNGTPEAEKALSNLVAVHGNRAPAEADVIVALGGDGFMLETLHLTRPLDKPVYGMNRGTVGFLMNEYAAHGLKARLSAAEEAIIHPLKMTARRRDGSSREALAINEVSLLRKGPQTARLRIHVDGRMRMEELVCDGALVCTAAGSTAYNYSAHGPILPIGADVLALTAISAFRPRRWRGALLPLSATVSFEVIQGDKRPVAATADGEEVDNVAWVDVRSDPSISHRLLFDPGHGLEERLLREQFA
ncbi:MAG: NAD kinase [Pseudomonadota bacterium]